jgi:hypothetical protein
MEVEGHESRNKWHVASPVVCVCLCCGCARCALPLERKSLDPYSLVNGLYTVERVRGVTLYLRFVATVVCALYERYIERSHATQDAPRGGRRSRRRTQCIIMYMIM